MNSRALLVCPFPAPAKAGKGGEEKALAQGSRVSQRRNGTNPSLSTGGEALFPLRHSENTQAPGQAPGPGPWEQAHPEKPHPNQTDLP